MDAIKLSAVKPLNIDRWLHGRFKPRNRIDRIGVEIEGGWSPASGIRPVVDRSVFKNMNDVKAVRALSKLGITLPSQVGEVASEKMIPAQLTGWMRKTFPTYVDESCGLHVHMSFERLSHYSRLMVPEYPATIIAYLKEWAKEEKLPDSHPLWERLDNKSEYCRQEFWPDEQMKPSRKDWDHNRPGHRYTVINYCFGRLKTMECRVLPMMADAAQSTRAVRRVLDITNASLVVLKGRNEAVKEKFKGSRIENIVESDIEII